MIPHHLPWCERQAINHATCYRLVADIQVTHGLRVLVELNHSNGVPTLVSVAIDRGKAPRVLLPLNATSSSQIGAALVEAGRLASKV